MQRHLRPSILLAVGFTILAVSATVLSVSAVWSNRDFLFIAGEFQDIRAISAPLLPAEQSDLDRAISLRDLIHNHVAVARSDFPYTEWWQPGTIYSRSLAGKEGYGHSCGGLTRLYLLALAAHGIPSRKVSLYSVVTDAPRPVPSHASVEALINGRWIAMDPTGNFSLMANGARIGWMQAARRAASGAPVHISFDDKQVKPFLKLETLDSMTASGVTLRALLAHVNIDAATFPASWDGVVRYADGGVFDSIDGGSRYRAFFRFAAGS